MKNPYGSNKSPKTIMDALETIKDIFDKHGIFFWLEAGSLLGAVREGKVIWGDFDGDISMWLKDSSKVFKLKKEFKERGYRLHCIGSKFELIWGDIIDNKDPNYGGHQTCIFMADIKKDYTIKVKWLKPISVLLRFVHPKNNLSKREPFNFLRVIWKAAILLKLYTDFCVRCPAYMLGDFTTISYYGKDYRIPEYSEAYLAFKYGDDWRTPRANYKGFKYRLKELL